MGAGALAAGASIVFTTDQRASVVSLQRISYPARSGSLLLSKKISEFGVTAPPSITLRGGAGAFAISASVFATTSAVRATWSKSMNFARSPYSTPFSVRGVWCSCR